PRVGLRQSQGSSLVRTRSAFIQRPSMVSSAAAIRPPRWRAVAGLANLFCGRCHTSVTRIRSGGHMTKPWAEIEAGAGFNSHVRAIFISDVHLGTRTARAAELLDFLKHFEADVIYLVGDIVDFWRVRRRPYWPQAHNDVVQKLLRKARKGVRVVV